MPTVRVRVDIFSGLENPVVELEGKKAEEVLARLKPQRALSMAEVKPTPPIPTLGYRGLIVEQVGARAARSLPKSFRVASGQLLGPELTHLPADEDFESFVFGSRGIIRQAKLGKGFVETAKRVVEESREVRGRLIANLSAKGAKKAGKKAGVAKAAAAVVAPGCTCAPIYEPAWWNDGGQKQFNNNCYNYSTNYRTDTFAQPGRASGIFITPATCFCNFVKPAAVRDSLIDAPAANNRCPPTGHVVALVVAPQFDFHWYRKGTDGLWTHKVGPAPVTNLDNAGNIITDPRTADRGPYTDFCGFMVVMHGHIKLR